MSEEALARLSAAASRAIDHAGAVSSDFDVGGSHVRLIGAGPALVDRITPAFAHLPTREADATPDVTVLLWDTASSGVGLPDLGAAGPTIGEAVAPILHDEGRSFVFHAYEGAVSHLDYGARLGVYATEDAARFPSWERACPLRALFTWWFLPRGQLVAHSAAVATPDGAVLIPGPGGSGKSTTALAAFADGFGYLGDDYVLLDPDGPTVRSLYGSAKLAADHMARFPGLLDPDPAASNDPADAKAVGWPVVARPAAKVLDAPVRAVVLPTVVGSGPSRVVEVSASRALLALAPSTLFQTPGNREGAFAVATAVTRQIPAFRLELGERIDNVPQLLRSVIGIG